MGNITGILSNNFAHAQAAGLSKHKQALAVNSPSTSTQAEQRPAPAHSSRAGHIHSDFGTRRPQSS